MAKSGRYFLFAAAAILFYQLIVPPVVGLADNGDFSKVTGRFDLFAPVHRTYEWVDTVYEINPEHHWVSDNYSSEILLVPPALWLNALFRKTPGFDLRFIGIVHGALFLAALWLFAPLIENRPRWLRWTIYGVVLFVYCDAMYVCALNSFYMDEPAILFLLLSVVLYLRVHRWQRKRDAVLLLLCLLMLVTSKSQHVLLAVLMAVVLAASARALPALRPHWWYAAAVTLVVAGGVMIRKAQPADYTAYAIYNVVFEQILPHSWSIDRTMAQLGLDDSYRRCIGMKAYVPNSGMEDPAFRERFMQRLPLSRLALFYLKHPSVAFRTMTNGLNDAGEQQALGNFELALGYPRLTKTHFFALWGEGKGLLFFHHGKRLWYVFVTLAACFGALLVWTRGSLPRGALLAGACLVAGACLELAMATLCDSMDIARHATMFLLLFDTILVSALSLALHGLAMRKQENGRLAERFHLVDQHRVG